MDPKIEPFEALEEKYEPTEFPDTETGNPCLLETYGPELELVKQTDPRHVWTVLDDDNGDLVVCAGFHFVNRVNYIITKKPWETGDEVFAY